MHPLSFHHGLIVGFILTVLAVAIFVVAVVTSLNCDKVSFNLLKENNCTQEFLGF